MSKKKILIIAAVIILAAGTGFYIIGSQQQKQKNPKTEILYREPEIYPEIIEKTFSESEVIDPIIDKEKHKMFYTQVREKVGFSPVYMPQFLPAGYKLYSTKIIADVSIKETIDTISGYRGGFVAIYKNTTEDELSFGVEYGDYFPLGDFFGIHKNITEDKLSFAGGDDGVSEVGEEKIRINIEGGRGANFFDYVGNNYLLFSYPTGYSYYLKSKNLQKQDLIDIANSLVEVK